MYQEMNMENKEVKTWSQMLGEMKSLKYGEKITLEDHSGSYVLMSKTTFDYFFAKGGISE